MIGSSIALSMQPPSEKWRNNREKERSSNKRVGEVRAYPVLRSALSVERQLKVEEELFHHLDERERKETGFNRSLCEGKKKVRKGKREEKDLYLWLKVDRLRESRITASSIKISNN